MFETAKWIAKEDISEIKAAPLFRKSFDVDGEIKEAKLNICGLGYEISYINGKEVCENVLTTPFTKYDIRVLYNTYDVTALLKPGKNTIGCILGNGCYFVTYPRWDLYKPSWLHHPKLIAELVIHLKGGNIQRIVTDSSWKTNDSAIIYNETKRGEIYDARCYINGWNLPELDDNEWQNAFICRSPGGVMEKNPSPPIRVKKTIKARHLGNNVYDIGENISGWARIKASGEYGRAIMMRYSEVLHDDGSIAPERLNTIIGSDTHFDKYIMRGDGEENYAPHFAYHGFRYVEVTGAPQEFELYGEMIHTDLDVVGSFKCNDEMLNKIHEASVRSTLSNFVGLPTDCPQREQNAWTGDALISLDQTLMNFDAVISYKKWLIDIRDTQRPNGQICCMAPTAGWGYNWGSGPAWDSIIIQLPYYIYYYTGDLSAVKEMWGSMKLYMTFMEAMSDNGILCFGLGDWCAPEGAEICPTVITDTSYFYVNNKIMARCAELLGEDGERYLKRAEEIKKIFRKEFIDKDFYLNNNVCAIACAIYQDLYNEDEKSVAAKQLSYLIESKGFHFDCGILGMKYIFSALSEYGYAKTVYKAVVNSEYPSYAFWINSGMTTLCEHWDMHESCNHHMYSEVDMWLYKHIAGIQLTEGAKSVIIKPCLMDEIKWIEAKHKNIMVKIKDAEIEINTDKDGVLILNNNAIEFKAGIHKFAIKR